MRAKTPTKPGTAFAGGFYAGRFFIGDQPFALVVAPKAQGEIGTTSWNTSEKRVVGATSYVDGLANTRAMRKTGCALAKQILDLRIGGFDDWYLPSRLQLLMAYHELAVAKGFSPGGKEAFDASWYWSSTQHAGGAACAWGQGFGGGNQSGWGKGGKLRARAVRSIKL